MNKELFALVEVLIDARIFSRAELLALTDKLKRFTTTAAPPRLNELICKIKKKIATLLGCCNS
ncbi:hypothetical protein [Lacrimispora brassicae]